MTLTQQQLDKLIAKYNGVRDEILLIGIRDDSNPMADQWNDLVGYATKDVIELFPGTTDPGVYWTFHQINPPHGAAHVVTGYHPNVWQVGMHFYWEALVQSGGPITIWRDDHNSFQQSADDPIQKGFFGIDYHHGGDSPTIGQWSAGCQVTQSTANFAKTMAAVKGSQKFKANPKATFSYLLVTKKDVDEVQAA